MTLLAAILLAAMKSSEAIAVLLNGSSAVGPETWRRARETVLSDAQDGKPLQQFVYGVVIDDDARAREFRDAARERITHLAEEKDNSLAWYLLAIDRNDLTVLRRAAEGGNVQALNALGTIAISEACDRKRQLSPNAVTNIFQQGFRYFSRAAEQRDANAFINLATCYQRGFGCSRDMALAFQSFQTAADKGHPEAMDYLSACYEHGHGVPSDAERSLYWRMRARAARGDKAADTWLRSRR